MLLKCICVLSLMTRLVTFPIVRAKVASAELVSEDPRVLNVHLVPHTHDDVGWLKTVDQYYYGTNNTIQHANVNSIISSVIRALQEDHRRTFTYVEMAFFSMWYNEQHPTKQDQVKDLVKQGQLNFANGGWCMHDEATTHYMGMIDQTSLGHDFLKKHFDYTPKVGWQLDPFGHSSVQASLMTSEMGFNALYFGRIDYQDLKKRQKERRCEGTWSPSQSLGTNVFWSLTGSYEGNYGAPPTFCFDMLCSDPPIVSDKNSSESNFSERLSSFMDHIKKQARRTHGNNIMITMGSDFQYENAFENFLNLDSLIDGITSYQKLELSFLEGLEDRFNRVNIFYSSPEIYTISKYNEHIEWEVKTDDFFPYSDCQHCFWTGYFTSRASLKRLERVGSSFLHVARQLEVLDERWLEGRERSELYELEKSVGIIQHHDGVSGTSKQHVAYDYAKRVFEGIQTASKYAGKVLARKLHGDVDLHFCHSLNVSICEISQEATKVFAKNDLYIVAYNALAIYRSDVLSVPVSLDATYKVFNTATGVEVHSELLPWRNYASVNGSSRYILYFETETLPPVGAIVYKIEMISKNSSLLVSKVVDGKRFLRSNEPKSFVVDNGRIAVKFNGTNGRLMHATRKDISASTDVSFEWGYYKSFVQQSDSGNKEKYVQSPQPQGGDSMGSGQCLAGYYDWEGDERKWLQDSSKLSQNSGAYIFRPQNSDENLTLVDSSSLKYEIIESDLVTEIHTDVSDWIKQVVRIIKGKTDIEINYTIGPIPVDQEGKEVVLRYATGIENDRVFFTDSNARDFVKRTRDRRETWNLEEFEPVAGNYYPINAAAYLEDTKASFAVVTDRSQGGASLKSGSIELMVQRRTTADDFRGVDEALDETDEGINPYPPYGDRKRNGKGIVVSGSHKLVIGQSGHGAAVARSLMDITFSPVHMFFTKVEASRTSFPFENQFISLTDSISFPENVMLTTFSLLHGKNNKYLVRVGHQYGVNEDEQLSLPTTIDLSMLFPGRKIVYIVEKTLSGNQDRQDWERSKMHWNDEEKLQSTSMNEGTSIVLGPLQIRTFEILVELLDFDEIVTN